MLYLFTPFYLFIFSRPRNINVVFGGLRTKRSGGRDDVREG